MILRRDRFDALVQRQLALFEDDNATLLAEAAEAEDAWRRASRENAEERYGDWQLVADELADRLLDLRETYAASLDEDVRAAYRGTFDRRAARLYPDYTGLLG